MKRRKTSKGWEKKKGTTVDGSARALLLVDMEKANHENAKKE